MSDFTLADLAATIAERAKSLPETSYTASLLELGPAHCARKFGEEAVETIVAALEQDKTAIVSEAADVVYHLLVLLQASGVGFEAVMSELGSRAGRGGLAEKAERTK
jgi:phosphoribosyl-ATP pyrophosphohydrolase